MAKEKPAPAAEPVRQLSEQTMAEMEAGRRQAELNAAAMAKAERQREEAAKK
jgi:hypothetical protein